jgi:methyl-accepting chemotaxis protein
MLKNMKIGTRLSLAFGLLLAFLLFNGGIAFKMIEDLNGEVNDLATDRMPKVEQANLIIDNINIIARALRNIIIDTSKETQEAELARVVKPGNSSARLIETLKSTTKSKEGLDKVQALFDARTAYIEQTDKYTAHIKAGEVDKAKAMLLTSLRAAQSKYFTAAEEVISYQTKMANDAATTAQQDAVRA